MQKGSKELGGLEGLKDTGWHCAAWVCLGAGDKTCFCPAGMQTGQWPRVEIIIPTCCEHSVFTVKNYGGLRAPA